jgi:hypothetical protein
MDEQIAKLVVVAGFMVGLLFWLFALGLYRKIAGAENPRKFDALIPGKSPGEAIDALISRGQLISPQAQLDRIAENRLAIRQTGIAVEFEAAGQSAGSRLTATVDDSVLTHRFQMGLGAFVLILMPIVVGGVPAALWHFVAQSPSSAVRWQSIQVLQIVHVLWPPFLIYFLWKQFRTTGANAASNLLVVAQATRGGRE